MPVVGQEPQTDPSSDCRGEARRRRHGEVLLVGQQIRVPEEGQCPQGDHAGGQTVQPVDEVDGVGTHHDEQDGDEDGCGGPQGNDGVRQRDPEHPHTTSHDDSGSKHLTSCLDPRSQIDEIVHDAD